MAGNGSSISYNLDSLQRRIGRNCGRRRWRSGLGGFYVKRGREGRKETPVGVIAIRHLATILRALHKLDVVKKHFKRGKVQEGGKVLLNHSRKEDIAGSRFHGEVAVLIMVLSIHQVH
ncbi:hypothetical protein RHSIM_Rhsim09G0099800 [Rhododendron simsii]|uniref:Uncharacterized protein n=1 Tax=Rhododendron simsii TaxID=118357 RepID=A0A834LEA3_RHOSS|nr:hypothetical protein RHSIM_Rhsim09G0099800 [Rhododendron simsii]